MTQQSDTPAEDKPVSSDSIEEQMIAATLGKPARLRYLEHLSTEYLRELGDRLSAFLRSEVSLSPVAPEYRSGSEVLAGIKDEDTLVAAELDPWTGKSLIQADEAVMMSMVYAFMGSRAAPGEDKDRERTRLESRLLVQIASFVLEGLLKQLKDIREVSIQSAEIEELGEEQPEWASAGRCLMVGGDLKIFDKEGRLTIILPDYLFGEDSEQLTEMPVVGVEGTGEWHDELSVLLRRADVTLTAVLEETQTDLSQVVAWKPGQTIAVGIDTSREFPVTCEGQEVFRALAGHRNDGTIALRLATEGKKVELEEHGTFD